MKAKSTNVVHVTKLNSLLVFRKHVDNLLFLSEKSNGTFRLPKALFTNFNLSNFVQYLKTDMGKSEHANLLSPRNY